MANGRAFPLILESENRVTVRFAAASVKAYESGGEKEFRGYLEALRSPTVDACIVAPNGKALPGCVCSTQELELAKQIIQDKSAHRAILGRFYLLGRPVDGSAGTYAFISEPVAAPFGHIWQLLVRVLLVIVIVSGLAYAASSAIARPIERFRKAAQSLGSGEMDVRIDHKRIGGSAEMRSLACDFNRMADRIQSLVQAQQALIRDTSHELRSPLARMKVATEIALQTDKSPTESLNRISRTIDQMDKLISDMIEISKLQSGEIVLSVEPVDVIASLQSVVADAEFEATGSGKLVNYSAPKELRMRTDIALISRAFENVVRNAIRYTPSERVVDIVVSAENGLTLKIRDYGPGVSEEDCKRIFDTFYRVGTDRDRRTGGFGLGLSIARRSIESLGGKIFADNAYPGLLVTIQVPDAK